MQIQYIKGMIGLALAMLIIGLSITISCQGKRIDGLKTDLESSEATSQSLRNDIVRLRAKIEEEAKIREKESTIVEKLFIKSVDVKTKYAKDNEKIKELEADPVALDWLDCTIPDDVRKLLQDITLNRGRVRKD